MTRPEPQPISRMVDALENGNASFACERMSVAGMLIGPWSGIRAYSLAWISHWSEVIPGNKTILTKGCSLFGILKVGSLLMTEVQSDLIICSKLRTGVMKMYTK